MLLCLGVATYHAKIVLKKCSAVSRNFELSVRFCGEVVFSSSFSEDDMLIEKDFLEEDEFRYDVSSE